MVGYKHISHHREDNFMPTFEQSLLSAPIGFNNGCLAINSLAENYETYVRHVGRVLVAQKQGQIPSRVSGIQNVNTNQVIEFIGRQYAAAASAPSSEEITKTLGSCTILSDDAIQGFVAVFEKLANANVEAKPKSHLGEMHDVKWKLGVAVASSSCSNLSSPYIALSWKIKDSNGSSSSHTAELSYPEFQEFLSTFRDISAVMDNL